VRRASTHTQREQHITNPTITYSLYTAAAADETSRLLGEVFAHRDPPAVAVGLTAAEFEAFVRLYHAKADAEGLTILARCAVTHRLVGALLAEDSGCEPPGGFDQVNGKFDPIFDILGQLDAEYSGGIARERGHSVHLLLVGVAEDHAGQGIAQRMVAECVANAERKGYRVAVTEATNRTSQQLFRKQGFTQRAQRSYRDHQFQGRAYFTSIASHEGPMLMDKHLGG